LIQLLAATFFWHEHPPVTAAWKNFFIRTEIVIATYSHQSSKAEMKRTKQQSLFNACNKTPKEGAEQGKLIFLMPI